MIKHDINLRKRKKKGMKRNIYITTEVLEQGLCYS